MQFSKLFFFILLIFSENLFAQEFSENIIPQVIGVFEVNGEKYLLSQNNFTKVNEMTSNQFFTEYYKSVYGENTQNPNFIIEGKTINFQPLVNISSFLGDETDILPHFIKNDFAKAFLGDDSTKTLLYLFLDSLLEQEINSNANHKK